MSFGSKSDAVANDAHTIRLQELVDKQQATIERQAKELQQAREQAEHYRYEWTEQVMKLTTAYLHLSKRQSLSVEYLPDYLANGKVPAPETEQGTQSVI